MILFRSALAIASGFKQVMTSLVLLSFATQLSRKEGITIPKPEYREYWDNTMVLLNENSEFILATHSETNWKIDVWKTGGLLYFSPASTSPDMTQPADNINLITTRHLSKTVVHNNGVVYYAAAMQTQSTVRGDEVQAIPSEHNTFVIKDAINEERKSSASDASIQFCRLRSRDVVNCEPLLPSQHSGTKGAIKVYCFLNPSFYDYGNQNTAQFPEGKITHCQEMEIISLDNMESSNVIDQNLECNGTVQKSVHDNQETEAYVNRNTSLCFDFMTDRRMLVEEFIPEVMTINENSTGYQPCSGRQSIDCMIMMPKWTTKPNSNIALKAEIIQKMLSIENSLSNDEVEKDKIMRVAESAQLYFNEEYILNDLRYSPSNCMSKTEKLRYNSIMSSFKGLEALGTGLDNDKTTLYSSKSVKRGGRMQSPPPAAECQWNGYQLATPKCIVMSPSPTPMRSPSPCAQQVENYALDAIPIRSNIEPSTSPACMSPSKMRKTCSTSTSSSLPAGGTAAAEDSDSLQDLVTSSFDKDDKKTCRNPSTRSVGQL